MIERWWLSPTHRQALEERAPLRVAAWMQDGPGRRLLSSDRQSAAVLLEGTSPLLLKWRHPLPSRRRKTFLRASRERRLEGKKRRGTLKAQRGRTPGE